MSNAARAFFALIASGEAAGAATTSGALQALAIAGVAACSFLALAPWKDDGE